MMRKILYKLSILLLAWWLPSTARAITTIRLIAADGSQYDGYIKRQKAGMDSIVFRADSFVCRIAKAQLYGSAGKYAVPLDGGNILAPITILADEDDTVKYKCRIAHEFTIKRTEVREIQPAKDYETQITGVDHSYKKYSGETITGTYDGEFPGKNISVIDSLGVTHVIGFADYETCRFLPRYPGESLYEQSPLLDRITAADGVHTGVICQQSFITEPQQDFYLLLEHKDGLRQKINIPSVVSYEKIPNPDYKPQYVNDLPKGRVAINGKYAFTIPVNANYTKPLYTVLVPKDKVVTVKADGNTARVSMEIRPKIGVTTENQFALLHLKQTIARRYKLEDETTFSIKPSSFVLKKSSNTAKYVFNVDATFINPLKPGSYAIMDKTRMEIIPVFIQK